MTWQQRLREKYGSNQKAADALHRKWKQGQGSKVSPQSLATKIGELVKGTSKWWEQPGRPLDLFCELLDVQREDVIGLSEPLKGTISFREFPRLPSLLPSEEPCRLGHASLLERVLEGKQRWIVAPAGSGKSLVIAYLKHRASVPAHTVMTLHDGVQRASAATFSVLEVEERSKDDERTLRELFHRPVVVMAPFEPPGQASHWSSGQWQSSYAVLSKDWRPTLLSWVEARVLNAPGDTKLARDDVLGWLNKHDPGSELVSTPGDLLALCADFDVFGNDGAGLQHRAGRWLANVGPSTFGAAVDLAWVRHASAQTFGTMVAHHLKRTRHEFGSLSTRQWGRLVPRGVNPKIEAAKPGSTMVAGYLRDAGLLRGGKSGVTPFPNWVHQGLLRSRLIRYFEKQSPAAWGAIALDESRQPIVDGALDALPHAVFRALLRQSAEAGEPSSVYDLAALETILAATARALSRGLELRPGDISNVHALVVRQLRHLMPEPGYSDPPVRVPFTRRQFDEWIATAWTLSFSVPSPLPPEGNFDRWIMPGWADSLRLADAPRGLPSWGSRIRAPLEQYASRVVDLLADDHLPEDVPRLLLPAILMKPQWRKRLRGRHLELLKAAEDRVVSQAQASPVKEREELADDLWQLTTKYLLMEKLTPTVIRHILYLRSNHPRLLTFIIECLTPAQLESTTAQHGLLNLDRDEAATLAVLRPELRRAAVKAWLADEGASAKHHEVREFIPILTVDDVDIAVEATSDRATAAEFADFVWRVNPARAREEARKGWERNPAGCSHWFWPAPRREVPLLAGLIDESNPPEWAIRWAYRHSLQAGPAAQKMYRISTRASQ